MEFNFGDPIASQIELFYVKLLEEVFSGNLEPVDYVTILENPHEVISMIINKEKYNQFFPEAIINFDQILDYRAKVGQMPIEIISKHATTIDRRLYSKSVHNFISVTIDKLFNLFETLQIEFLQDKLQEGLNQNFPVMFEDVPILPSFFVLLDKFSQVWSEYPLLHMFYEVGLLKGWINEKDLEEEFIAFFLNKYFINRKSMGGITSQNFITYSYIPFLKTLIPSKERFGSSKLKK